MSAIQKFFVFFVALILVACGPTPEEVGSQVRQSMQETLAKDPNFSELKLEIVKVVVVKEEGSKYQGIATVKTKKGTEKQVPVQITAGDGNVIWKTEPAVFLFAVQEEIGALFSRKDPRPEA